MERKNGTLRLIALFKLVKALSLIAVGIASLKLVHSDVAGKLADWIVRLGLDPGNRFIERALIKAGDISPDKMRDMGIGSFIYAALFLTEGIGLWMMKRWAEWFTVISTGSLLPIEIYEIHRHPSVVKVLVLLVNVAVVAYLIYRIRSERAGKSSR